MSDFSPFRDPRENGNTGVVLSVPEPRILMLSPVGPFEIESYVLAHLDGGVKPVATLTMRVDSLALCHEAFSRIGAQVDVVLKRLREELERAQIARPDAATIHAVGKSKA